MTNAPAVRALAPPDRPSWSRLWDAYLVFYEHELAPEVSDDTFARLTAGSGPLLGLIATNEEGTALGFANLVFHPSTWARTEYCYLEDLYVDASARRSGVARALIAETYSQADARGAEKVYWQTQRGNREARALYEEIASDTGYLVYERPET